MLNRIAVPVLLLFAIILALQLTPDSADGADICPSISVSGYPSGEHGAQFAANVNGATGDVTYSWSISAGMIEEGQGTPAITVGDVGSPGSTVTATVDIGGLSPECSTSASETVEIPAPEAQ